jgi:hypothetical protein
MDYFFDFPASRDGAASKDKLLRAYAGALQLLQDMGKLSWMMKTSPRVRLKEKVWLITPCNRSILNLPNASCHAQRHRAYLECMYNRSLSNWMYRAALSLRQFYQGGPGLLGCSNMTTRHFGARSNSSSLSAAQ